MSKLLSLIFRDYTEYNKDIDRLEKGDMAMIIDPEGINPLDQQYMSLTVQERQITELRKLKLGALKETINYKENS